MNRRSLDPIGMVVTSIVGAIVMALIQRAFKALRPGGTDDVTTSKKAGKARKRSAAEA